MGTDSITSLSPLATSVAMVHESLRPLSLAVAEQRRLGRRRCSSWKEYVTIQGTLIMLGYVSVDKLREYRAKVRWQTTFPPWPRSIRITSAPRSPQSTGVPSRSAKQMCHFLSNPSPKSSPWRSPTKLWVMNCGNASDVNHQVRRSAPRSSRVLSLRVACMCSLLHSAVSFRPPFQLARPAGTRERKAPKSIHQRGRHRHHRCTTK